MYGRTSRDAINGYQYTNPSLPDNSPWTQVAILGFVTFCSVGMFSAVSGLGAGYVGPEYQ